MTKLLEQAVDRAQRLPPEAQDEIARIVLAYAELDEDPIALTHEEDAAIAKSIAAAARGEFATEEDIRALWAKHGL